MSRYIQTYVLYYLYFLLLLEVYKKENKALAHANALFIIEYVPKYVFGVNSFHNVLHTDDEKLRLLKFKPMIYMFILLF